MNDHETVFEYMERAGLTPDEQAKVLEYSKASTYSVSEIVTAFIFAKLAAPVLVRLSEKVTEIVHQAYNSEKPRHKAQQRSRADVQRKRRPGKYHWGGPG
jgi:hypothetical protein